MQIKEGIATTRRDGLHQWWWRKMRRCSRSVVVRGGRRTISSIVISHSGISTNATTARVGVAKSNKRNSTSSKCIVGVARRDDSGGVGVRTMMANADVADGGAVRSGSSTSAKRSSSLDLLALALLFVCINFANWRSCAGSILAAGIITSSGGADEATSKSVLNPDHLNATTRHWLHLSAADAGNISQLDERLHYAVWMHTFIENIDKVSHSARDSNRVVSLESHLNASEPSHHDAGDAMLLDLLATTDATRNCAKCQRQTSVDADRLAKTGWNHHNHSKDLRPTHFVRTRQRRRAHQRQEFHRKGGNRIMKREVYPLPPKPTINSETSSSSSSQSTRQEAIRNTYRNADDAKTISFASIITGKQEERILSSVSPASSSGITSSAASLFDPMPTSSIIQATTTYPVRSLPSRPTGGMSSTVEPPVNRFKTSNAFEAAAKLRFNDQHHQWRPHHSSASEGAAVSPSNEGVDDVAVVTLLGLFELSAKNNTVRPEGHNELAAARLAVRHVNEQRLLPGYRLELVTNDTKCDPGVGVDRFFHALYTQTSKRMIMLLGTACSDVTESLAKVVPYWNIVQVSFGSTSPALSDRREFPFFYRTVAPDSSHNEARIAFIRRFGWDTVTTFSQNEEVHSLAVNDLVTQLERANITCAATITFAETDIGDQLRLLRDLDTRIIIGSFSDELAPRIFCEAYKLGMYGADYAWILHETIRTRWWRLRTAECTREQVGKATENVLIVSSYNGIVGNGRSASGLTSQRFMQAVSRHSSRVSQYAPQTYDAVWAIALALRAAEIRWQNGSSETSTGAARTLGEFDYSKNDMTLEFMRQLDQLKFMGVSGPVSFRGADRVGTSIILQIQHRKLRTVALFHPSTGHLDFKCLGCLPVQWQGGQVPIARRVFRLKVDTIAPTAFYTVTTFASIGITVSLAFLAFNLHFRKLKSIKLSSPKLSNIIAVGCILVYAAVILLGLDYSTLPASDKAFSIICTARVYLLSSGFSLAFGSMFAKTYRVHRIFTLTGGGGVCKDKMLRDTQLISLVCALLLLDGLVVTLWVVVDPMERHLSNLTLEFSLTDRSVVYQPQVEVCRSHHTQSWLGALYAYKGLLLIVGVYMAWETRHVKIPALNDSQYIGVSVYSVVITSAIVVVLANLIAERVTLAFLTIAALILTSTTATLCLLFVPKIYDICGGGGMTNIDPIGRSMGLKMEYNTRRFLTDDRRELQYRVEVQNRVYKKEMAALDVEIAKLQRLLDSRSSTSSSSDRSVMQSIKQEIAFINELNEHNGPAAVPGCPTDVRTLSIGGGLPMLLLSVLPPVIPRASWPSSDGHSALGRHSISFSSQPHLDEVNRQSTVTRLPAIDLLNLRLTHQQATADNRTGWLDRIRGIFSTRKDSSVSVSDTLPSSAFHFKRQLGKLTGRFSYQTAASCNALHLSTGTKPMKSNKISKSGSALHRMGINEEYLTVDHRHLPPFTISDHSKIMDDQQPPIPLDPLSRTLFSSTEPKVLFQLPDKGRRISNVLPAEMSLRERIRGSPRFPHRIAPTSSLGALTDCLPEDLAECQVLRLKSKWKSMDDTSFTSASSSSPSSDASIDPNHSVCGSGHTSINCGDLPIDDDLEKDATQVEDDDSISIISVIGQSVIYLDDERSNEGNGQI